MRAANRCKFEDASAMMQPNISGEPLSEKHKNNDWVHTLVRKRKPLSDRKRRTDNNMFRELQQHKRIQCLMLQLRSTASSNLLPANSVRDSMTQRLLSDLDESFVLARCLLVHFESIPHLLAALACEQQGFVGAVGSDPGHSDERRLCTNIAIAITNCEGGSCPSIALITDITLPTSTESVDDAVDGFACCPVDCVAGRSARKIGILAGRLPMAATPPLGDRDRLRGGPCALLTSASMTRWRRSFLSSLKSSAVPPPDASPCPAQLASLRQ